MTDPATHLAGARGANAGRWRGAAAKMGAEMLAQDTRAVEERGVGGRCNWRDSPGKGAPARARLRAGRVCSALGAHLRGPGGRPDSEAEAHASDLQGLDAVRSAPRSQGAGGNESALRRPTSPDGQGVGPRRLRGGDQRLEALCVERPGDIGGAGAKAQR